MRGADATATKQGLLENTSRSGPHRGRMTGTEKQAALRLGGLIAEPAEALHRSDQDDVAKHASGETTVSPARPEIPTAPASVGHATRYAAPGIVRQIARPQQQRQRLVRRVLRGLPDGRAPPK